MCTYVDAFTIHSAKEYAYVYKYVSYEHAGFTKYNYRR